MNTLCPRCCKSLEDSIHMFREFPILEETWIATSKQCRIFYCGLWTLCTSRNCLVHEMKTMFGKEILDWTITYVREPKGIEKEKLTRMRDLDKWEPPHEPFLKINFDEAYDPQHARFGSGVVLRNLLGEILAFMVVGHRAISSPFVAKAQMCVQVLRLGIRMGIECVIIKGDSLEPIKKVKSDSEDKSEIGAITKNIEQYK
ncbi:hypothetical protein Golob_006032 [Gossypium lobatum]|uniref:RNase H type-1 domain-containing protein n=1 Tax=Gossypium lobatum TaxID=34289 RepID=A0A7J8MUZ8_9ROSI|nr:hypothetical protein [Gossypium lobatum]